MAWPQWALLVLYGLSWFITLGKHGEPAKPHDIVVTTASLCVTLLLLTAGGFFQGGAQWP